MCYCDYDPPTVFESAIVKARKPHVCCSCGLMIRAGLHYERISGLWDGSWSTFALCTFCRGLSTWLQDHDDCCILLTDIMHDARETWRNCHPRKISA